LGSLIDAAAAALIMISLCIENGTAEVFLIFLPLFFFFDAGESSAASASGSGEALESTFFSFFFYFLADFLVLDLLFFFFDALNGLATGEVVTLGSSMMKSWPPFTPEGGEPTISFYGLGPSPSPSSSLSDSSSITSSLA
jgi:hypothetical protein